MRWRRGSTEKTEIRGDQLVPKSTTQSDLLLETTPAQMLAIPEVEHAFFLVTEHRIDPRAGDAPWLEALLTHESFDTRLHGVVGGHGPYRIDALESSHFRPATRHEVRKAFAAELDSFYPDEPIDPWPVVDRLVDLPENADYFVLEPPWVDAWMETSCDTCEGDHPWFVAFPWVFAGWREAIIIDRARRTLMTVALAMD